MGLYDFEFLKGIEFYINGEQIPVSVWDMTKDPLPKNAIEEPEPKEDKDTLDNLNKLFKEE